MTNAIRDEIIAFARANPFARSQAISTKFKVSRRKVKTILERLAAGRCQLDYDCQPPMTPASKPVIADAVPDDFSKRTYSESGDTAECRFVSTKIVKTYEDALEAAEVDSRVWEVEKWECTQWTVASFDASKTPITAQNYRVHLKLRRKVAKFVVDAIDGLVANLRVDSPEFVLAPHVAGKGGEPTLASIAAFDVHFGRLAWAPETGEDCDLKITDHRFRTVVEKLVEACNRRNTVEIVFPCGSDFFQMDNVHNTTAAGTPQDVDGRYAKVFETGLRAYLWAVGRFAEIAPVFVPLVPGNHDTSLSYHLAVVAGAYYAKNDRVKVDHTPIPRKYHFWNKTLLGFTHGDQEKPADLPIIMATERPEEWAKSTCREWATGHIHQSRRMQTKPVDTHNGVVIRTSLSISGADHYHHKKGFIGSKMGSHAYFYGEDSGYCGEEVASV